jgi:hypothetical protein
MTMHLAHPSLTTTGKKRGKKKWASAEHKRRAEQLKAEREAMLREYNIRPQARKCQKGAKTPTEPRKINSRYEDHLKTEIKSVEPTWAVCAPPPARRYSGERQLLGIATMHKSNMVPVFADNKEVAVDIARMRRG